MNNQNFKLCYIDAFAGSGDLDVPGIGSILNWDSLFSMGETGNRNIAIVPNVQYEFRRLPETAVNREGRKTIINNPAGL